MSPLIHRPCPACRVALIAAPARRCPACEAAYQRARDGRRGDRHQRGYGSQHEAWAREVLRLHPVCPCGAPATVADHILPWRDAPELKYSLANGQGLCLACSGRKDGGVRR